MRGKAGPFLAAVLLLAGCAKARPDGSPAAAPVAFQSSFVGRVSFPEGGFRLRGVLAAAPGGRLRAEIVGPTVTAPILLVASERSLGAFLLSDRIAWIGTPDEPLLREIVGVDLAPASLSALLLGQRAPLPADCSLSRTRLRRIVGGEAGVPGRIEIRCGDRGIRLRLEKPTPLPMGGSRDPFLPPDLPAGFERVDLATLGRSIREIATRSR